MPRRTKIIATIGPASDSEATLRKLVDAGMDVARLGLAHGSIDEAVERYRRIRSVAADSGRRVGILVDLPGPKIRAASFPEEGAELAQGDTIRIVPGSSGSTSDVVEIEYDPYALDDRVAAFVQRLIDEGAIRATGWQSAPVETITLNAREDS